MLTNVVAWISAVPGVAAILAGLVGYGALLNRVKNMEAEMATVKSDLAELRAQGIVVARIDERSLAQQSVTERLTGQLDRMDHKLDGVLIASVREARTFRDDARSPA